MKLGSHRKRATLGDELSSGPNALNFLRLVLAGMVIVSHSWALGGFGGGRIDLLGEFAVNGFFGVSGYLISGSRLRLSPRGFAIRRAARLLPGLWVCLAVTALVAAPLAAALNNESYSVTSALKYILTNGALQSGQPGIDATLLHVPFPIAWNGSLWSLWYEAVAYCIAGVILSRRWGTARAIPILLGLVVLALPLTTWMAHEALHITTNRYLWLLRLGGYFAAGMAIYQLRRKIPASKSYTIASLAIVVCAVLVLPRWGYESATPIFWTYAILCLGTLLPIRLGATNDISYGMYIYAFPVQQLLIVTGTHHFGPYVVVLASLAGTIPLAWLSWRFVEHGAIQWARRFR